MGKGSCYCGKITFSFEGEPINKVACHCTDCRKISGSAYSTNIVISSASFSLLTGTPKSYSAKADSGRVVTTVFCGDCGSSLWRVGDMSDEQGIMVVRVGVLDGEEAVEENKPAAEVYTCGRASWVGEVEGAQQNEKFF
ncbi:hypothetical protein KCU99_g3769, partial [Aureobasidium melanogenum]